MLEEIGYDFKVTKIDLGKEEQLKPEFIKLKKKENNNLQEIFYKGSDKKGRF